MDQLIRQGWESVELTLGVSILENYVLPVDIAEFTKFPMERLDRECRRRGTNCKPAYLGPLRRLLRFDVRPEHKEQSAESKTEDLLPDY
jgi:hypothetical protein